MDGLEAEYLFSNATNHGLAPGQTEKGPMVAPSEVPETWHEGIDWPFFLYNSECTLETFRFHNHYVSPLGR